MSFYAFPSALALVIKTWLFFHAGRTLLEKCNLSLTLFLSALFVMNLIEFISFSARDYVAQYIPPIFFLLVFYTAFIYSISSLICLSAKLSGYQIFYRPKILYAIATLFSVLIIGSDLLIAGIQTIGYSMTRIPGDYYWLFQVYAIIGLLLSGILLTAGCFVNKREQKKRCVVLVAALTPFVLGIITVVILMRFGININATLVLSITISIFLIVLIYTEDRTRLFKLLIKIPYTRENMTHNKILNTIYPTLSGQYNDCPIVLRESLQQIEGAIIESVYRECGGNQVRTAAFLSMAPSTLNQKIKKMALK